MAFLQMVANTLTVFFLLIVLSYYVLLFLKEKKPHPVDAFTSISIIIPAHNEEEYIEKTVESVLAADFIHKKQIIVVDDGSSDKTPHLLQPFSKRGVTIITTVHTGKSASINRALKKATGELIAIVDGDSVIRKDALLRVTEEIGIANTAACTCVIKVKNRKKFFCMWFHIEQLYNSLMRLLFSKLNANIVTPGPLSVYRRKALDDVGGFSTEGFSEDADITIRLIRKGYRVGYAAKGVAETNLPYDVKGVLRQRTRFARGTLNIFKRHLRLNSSIIDMYTLPLLVFMYVQAVILAPFTIYQIVSGYLAYFVSEGIYFSGKVALFFFDWFTIIGFGKWAWSVIIGSAPFSIISAIGIISGFLSYPLYVYAIIKFDRKIDLYHIIPFVFMFPFWMVVMFIYILCLPEFFKKRQNNIWKKNE